MKELKAVRGAGLTKGWPVNLARELWSLVPAQPRALPTVPVLEDQSVVHGTFPTLICSFPSHCLSSISENAILITHFTALSFANHNLTFRLGNRLSFVFLSAPFFRLAELLAFQALFSQFRKCFCPIPCRRHFGDDLFCISVAVRWRGAAVL